MHLPIESHLQSDHTSSLLSIDLQLSTTKSEGVKVFIEMCMYPYHRCHGLYDSISCWVYSVFDSDSRFLKYSQ